MCPPDQENTKETQEQVVLDEQINHQPIEEASGNNTETSVPITETLVPKAHQSQDTNHASTISYHVAQDRCATLNGKLKEGVYVKQPPGFESSEFPDYVCELDKGLYRLKQAPACSSVNTLMVPPNNIGPDLAGKPVNETLYIGMIRSLMYLTATRYLKGTSSLGLWYPKCLSFDLKGYSNSDYAISNMDRKSTSDDDEDDDDSHASTPSPTTYLNSLSLLNYKKYDILTCSIKLNKSIKKLKVDSNHPARHCEESSERKRNEDVK
ncbi:retrovirus-related pol polyprotein from transposon TNT 1-94 [Tanacetum coccineum]